MTDRPEMHHLNLPDAPERLQAVLAIGANTFRRGLSAYELERLFDHMLPGRAGAARSALRPYICAEQERPLRL